MSDNKLLKKKFNQELLEKVLAKYEWNKQGYIHSSEFLSIVKQHHDDLSEALKEIQQESQHQTAEDIIKLLKNMKVGTDNFVLMHRIINEVKSKYKVKQMNKKEETIKTLTDEQKVLSDQIFEEIISDIKQWDNWETALMWVEYKLKDNKLSSKESLSKEQD